MSDPLATLLPLGFLLVALLYSSVGHAGATGYLALMALAGIAPETMRPTALVLNLDADRVFPRTPPAKGISEMTIAERQASIAADRAHGAPLVHSASPP